MHPVLVLKLLALLAVANGAPLAGRKLLANALGYPVDGGTRFFDNRPLFGPSKTIRGVVLAVLASALVAPLLGFDIATGIVVGAMAMTGDLLSSFLKRRAGLPSSARATGLDQIPEALFPLIACRAVLGLSPLDIVITTVAFFVGEIVASRLLYQLRLRDHPY